MGRLPQCRALPPPRARVCRAHSLPADRAVHAVRTVRHALEAQASRATHVPQPRVTPGRLPRALGSLGNVCILHFARWDAPHIGIVS